MINIDELRQRVEAAEQRFGLLDSSRRKASERLIGMMNAIEQDQSQKQTQLEESKALISSMAKENQQLRSMLHQLLLAIESSGSDQGAEILRQMDDKLTAMAGTGDRTSDDQAAEGEEENSLAGAEMVTSEAADEGITDEVIADEVIADEVLPEPPGVLPMAVSDAMAPAAPEQVAEANGEAVVDDAGSGYDDSDGGASEGTSKVREILERMAQEKLQKSAANAAS